MAILSYANLEFNFSAPVVYPPPCAKNVANAADRAAMSAAQYRASMRHAPRIVIPSPIYRCKVKALDVIPKFFALVCHHVERPSSRSATGGDDDDGPSAHALAVATNRSLHGAK